MANTHPYATEIRSLLMTLNKHGFSPFKVYDRCETEKTSSQKSAAEVILSVDESWLYVKDSSNNKFTVYIVLGNEPGEAVCDSSNYEPLNVATDEHYSRWSS